jgi:hypothetical protein
MEDGFEERLRVGLRDYQINIKNFSFMRNMRNIEVLDPSPVLTHSDEDGEEICCVDPVHPLLHRAPVRHVRDEDMQAPGQDQEEKWRIIAASTQESQDRAKAVLDRGSQAECSAQEREARLWQSTRPWWLDFERSQRTGVEQRLWWPRRPQRKRPQWQGQIDVPLK